MTDQLAKAIEAVEQQASSVEMVQFQLKLPPNGRPAVIAIPKDVTDFEIIAVMVQVAAIGDQLRAQRPASRIIVPNVVTPS